MKAQSKGNVIVLAKYGGRGLTTERAVEKANKQRLIILSNKLLDGRLVTTDKWKNDGVVYPVWSGTMTAYVEPGKSFKESNRKEDGKYVVYVDPKTNITYRFQVPKDYRSAKNAILAIDHGFDEKGNPTFEIHEDGKNQRVIHVPNESNIKLVQDFPAKDGWHLTENDFLIPVGSKINRSNRNAPYNRNARYLHRTDKYVGLLARGYGFGYDYGVRRIVNADYRSSDRFGVLAASPEGVAAKNLQELAAGAEKALGQIGTAVDEKLLKPIRKLIDAAKE